MIRFGLIVTVHKDRRLSRHLDFFTVPKSVQKYYVFYTRVLWFFFLPGIIRDSAGMYLRADTLYITTGVFR